MVLLLIALDEIFTISFHMLDEDIFWESKQIAANAPAKSMSFNLLDHI